MHYQDDTKTDPEMLSTQEGIDMLAMKKQEEKERRRDTRRPFSRYVLYVTAGGMHQGDLIDYSTSGLYIKTRHAPKLGTFLTVALPYAEGEHEKRKAMVVRVDSDGFAVEFFKDPDSKVYRTDIMSM